MQWRIVIQQELMLELSSGGGPPTSSLEKLIRIGGHADLDRGEEERAEGEAPDSRMRNREVQRIQWPTPASIEAVFGCSASEKLTIRRIRVRIENKCQTML